MKRKRGAGRFSWRALRLCDFARDNPGRPHRKTASGMISRKAATAQRHPRAAGNGIQKEIGGEPGASTKTGTNQWAEEASSAGQASGRWTERTSISLKKSSTSSAAPPKHDGRFVTVGPLALFSTETGDAWLLDPKDHLAARLARDGDPEDLYFEETDVSFAHRLERKLPN
jgi:hypothetical protein